MQQEQVQKPEMKLVGIKVRTNNKLELEGTSAKIAPCVQRYFQQQLFEKIPDRKNPGTTLSVYTEYESDHTGDYTYFIGEEVASFDNIPAGFETHTIPVQTYARFTTKSGPMPGVVVDAWQKIWQMSPQDFGGNRRYHTDFEVYDERAQDPQKVVLDIFIGIEA